MFEVFMEGGSTEGHCPAGAGLVLDFSKESKKKRKFRLFPSRRKTGRRKPGGRGGGRATDLERIIEK